MRALENATFVVITNQAGKAGTVDFYREDYRRQPYHGGGSLVFAPNGSLLAETQADAIGPEMILADLNAQAFAQARGKCQFSVA